MIVIEPFTLPEIIPQNELEAFRASIRKMDMNCPPEVREFIDALAEKLDLFIRFQIDQGFISGKDLHLAGMTHWKGERVFSALTYRLDVPRMIACDHRAAMYKIFRKRGKRGLIDFCKAKVKGTHLEMLLRILNVEVFHEHGAEFTSMMEKILASKKLETEVLV